MQRLATFTTGNRDVHVSQLMLFASKRTMATVMVISTPTNTPTGLSDAEVQARRAAGQGNTAPPTTGRSYHQIVVENLFTFPNMSLVALGIMLVLVGRPTDALLSTGIITLNVLVSVVQEIRAKRTLDRIALLARPRARVIRGGAEREVPPEELVLGDLLAVRPGDQMVVDGKVSGDTQFGVDESQLTGESEPVQKTSGDPVYSGSYCTSGSGTYVAERVGSQSLATQITAGARAFRRVLTPLQRGIDMVIRLVLLIVAYLQFLLVLRSLLERADLASRVQNATVVAGLVPNGLFLSISVAYALAAVRIVQQGVLVQQSNAIESLSNVDTLCLDKTGTLTANRLHVNGLYPISAEVTETELGRIVGAFVASARTQNKTSEAIAVAYPARPHRLIGEVPFSSVRKWSALSFDDAKPDQDELRLSGADVGIAMQSGSAATRGVADLVLLNDSFASLLRALAEGQRIVNGMVHILELFLTRIAIMGIVILSALVLGQFPIELRQASLVTLLSVGVPSVFLALWAQPQHAPKGSVPSRVAQFVVPPVFVTGAIALLLFYGCSMLQRQANWMEGRPRRTLRPSMLPSCLWRGRASRLSLSLAVCSSSCSQCRRPPGGRVQSD